MEKTINVLDHGYVKYVAHLGSDEFIIENARTSTGRGFVSWEPYMRCTKCGNVLYLKHVSSPMKCRWIKSATESTVEICGSTDFENFPRGDLGILEYLYKNRHTSPFEFGELVIEVQAPMDVWRQWIRHRTASVNEYSTRYSEAIDLMQETPPDQWRKQGTTNRQGSGEYLPVGVASPSVTAGHGGAELSRLEVEFQHLAREVYEERLAAGVAKEQARKDLPLSTYTKARWKIDLHNVLHFLGLRMHSHAQWEIRQYANAVAEMVKGIWPRTFALFEEHSLYAVHLSRTEAANTLALLKMLIAAEGPVEPSRQKMVDDLLKKLGR